MYNQIMRSCVFLWGIVFTFATVSEMSLVTSDLGIGALKHLSFILLIPFCMISLLNEKEINVGEVTFFLVFFMIFLILQQLLLGNLNLANWYARISIIFFVLFTFFLNKERLSGFVLMTLFYSLLISLTLFFILNILNSVELFQYTNRSRFTGGFGHAGKFSNLILCLVLISFYLFRSSLFRNVFILLCISVIIYTQTRNVQLLIFIVSLYLFLGRYKIFVVPAIYLGAVLLLLLIFLDTSAYEAVNKISSSRFSWWGYGINLNLSYELKNVFFGSNSLISPLTDKDGVSSNLFHFDNSYFEVLLRDGLIGFLFFVIAIKISFAKATIPVNNLNSNFIHAMKVSILIFFFFDSGLLSAGNFLFVTAWVLCTGFKFEDEKK